MLKVDMVIDVTVVARTDSLAVVKEVVDTPVAFVVTNHSNARQMFALTAVSGASIAEDDGDGVYKSQHDSAADTITLDAGASRTIFAIAHGPFDKTSTIALTAAAVVGHGTPGTVLGGAGIDGVDAILGMSGGTATAQTILTIDEVQPTLVKSQSVMAPDGSSRPATAATITYRIDARFPGAARDAQIFDDVPAGTTFVPGSIVVDGRSMTDARDEDAASFDGITVVIALGDIASATSRSIQFQTKIQ